MTALVKFQSKGKSNNFSGSKVEKKEWKVVPEGDYIGVLKKVDEKVSKNGNKYLNVAFEVTTEGNPALVFAKFMLDHPNADVVKGASYRIQAMAKALGKADGIEDTSELTGMIGQKCMLKVVIKPGNNGYADFNDIGKFLKY